jgi:cytochrome c'
MRVVATVLSSFLIMIGVAGCQGTSEPAKPAAAAATAGPTAQPYGSLAQVMRSIPFPNSNIIFDAQTNDPGAAKKPEPGKATTGAAAAYANVYTGWAQVENSAVALSETANLIMIPGRLCENGLPVPLERDDFKKAAQGLVDAGKVALKAAKAKNLDQMVDAAGTVSDACQACHMVYRDKPEGKMRCVPN